MSGIQNFDLRHFRIFSIQYNDVKSQMSSCPVNISCNMGNEMANTMNKVCPVEH